MFKVHKRVAGLIFIRVRLQRQFLWANGGLTGANGGGGTRNRRQITVSVALITSAPVFALPNQLNLRFYPIAVYSTKSHHLDEIKI